MSSLHCKIPEAHDRASLHSRRAEMKWIRILTELFSQDRRWSESEYQLRSWRHFSKVLSLVMILGPFRRPSCILQVSFTGVNYRRCSPGSWMHQFSGRGRKGWLSLSLPPPTLSSCLPVAAFAISGPASSTTNWSSQPRAICESSPRLHVVERIRISNTLNILKLLENFFMVVLSPQVRVESYFTLLFHLISFQIVGTAACVFGSTICMIFVLSIKLLVMVARFLWPDFRNDRSEYNRICC